MTTSRRLGVAHPFRASFGALLLVVLACAEATEPPVPVLVTPIAGHDQEAYSGDVLADSLVVIVSDQNGKPMVGSWVLWAAARGTVSPDESFTDMSGRTAAAWKLGSTGMQTVTATVPGLPPAHFSAWSRNGPAITGTAINPVTVNVASSPAIVHVTVRATDGLLGVTDVYILFASPSFAFIPATLELQSGTRNDGLWIGTITIPQGAESGTWRFFRLTVRNPARFLVVEHSLPHLVVTK